MKLAELFSIFTNYRLGENIEAEVKGLTTDSREVEAGSVFVALKGTKADGHDYLEDVCAKGALGLVVENLESVPASFKGACVQVTNSRTALAELASRYYGNPTDKLYCVGVTGTNGKTSVCLMVEKVLNDFDWPTGVMGTIDHHLGEKLWKSDLTTPDPITLNRRLYEFVALGAKAAVFEVSSHAIDQGRAENISFDAVVFTNLSRDHLDYHGTMEAYFETKQKLFNEYPWQTSKHVTAVVNRGDQWGAKLEVAEKCDVIGFAESKSDLQVQILSTKYEGTKYRVKSKETELESFLPLPGRHNVQNAVAAAAVGKAAGRSLASCLKSLESFAGIPGRLEPVPNDKNLFVFVDYAHTDEALRTSLEVLGEIRSSAKLKNQIFCVFGCGGDRDKGKRPLMARAAEKGADFVFVTSDNPRTEDPMSIVKDILPGFSEQMKNELEVELDRREAIRKAIQKASVGDVVLIAGKGHEDYQIIGDQVREFSDLKTAKEILDGL